MSDSVSEVKVGGQIPDFQLKVYRPDEDDFGSIDFASLKAEGKWTSLFFYTADFAFV